MCLSFLTQYNEYVLLGHIVNMQLGLEVSHINLKGIMIGFLNNLINYTFITLGNCISLFFKRCYQDIHIFV